MLKLFGALLFSATLPNPTGDGSENQYPAISVSQSRSSIISSTDTQAPIRQTGSIAKYACTLAAFRLQNMGKLSIDDPVSKLLPEFEGPNDPQLTLRRLLENRSGLQDMVVHALLSDPDLPNRSIPAQDAANMFATKASEAMPGMEFDYVNSNWILVQAILERKGGKKIGLLLDDLVFTPAKADSAGFFVGDIVGPDRDTSDKDYLLLPDFISCAGGLEARPKDLLMISAYPFTSEDFDAEDRASLAEITTPDQNYTVGGRFLPVIDETGRRRTISWQEGSNGPWFAMAVYDPKTGNGIAATTSTDVEGVIAIRDAWLADNGLKRADVPDK